MNCLTLLRYSVSGLRCFITKGAYRLESANMSVPFRVFKTRRWVPSGIVKKQIQNRLQWLQQEESESERPLSTTNDQLTNACFVVNVTLEVRGQIVQFLNEFIRNEHSKFRVWHRLDLFKNSCSCCNVILLSHPAEEILRDTTIYILETRE